MNPNGFHGDARNECCVCELEQFAHRTAVAAFDPRCETFVAPEAFCWNCALISERPGYRHFKCCGHPRGVTEGPAHRELQYADESTGLVSALSESSLSMLTRLVSHIAGPGYQHGSLLRFDIVHGLYHECPPPQYEQLLDMTIAFLLGPLPSSHRRVPARTPSQRCQLASA